MIDKPQPEGAADLSMTDTVTPATPMRRKTRRRKARRRRVVRVTTEGMLFIGLALLIGMAAINTGQNLLYFILAVMLVMLMLSGWLSRINLARLDIQLHPPEEFHAREDVVATLSLRNRKRLASTYGVECQAEIEPATEPDADEESMPDPPPEGWPLVRQFVLAVPPRQTIQTSVPMRLPRRGVYRIAATYALSSYPFGFIERALRGGTARRVLVYPALLPPVSVMTRAPSLLGKIEGSRRGHGADLFGIRDYQQGDPVRHIHWKLSARGQGMKLKEFAEEENRRFVIMLDLRGSRRPDPALRETFERSLSVAATLTRMLTQAEAQVGMWTTMGNVPVGEGPGHQRRIMRALAEVSLQPPAANPALPDKPGGDVTEIWIDFMPDDNRGAHPDAVIRRAPNSLVIDVNTIDFDQIERETPD